MTYENFVYWLRGFLEIANPEYITKEQIDVINTHLNLCLNNITRFDTNKIDEKLKNLYTYNNQVISPPFSPPNKPSQFDCIVMNGGSC